MTDFYTNVTLNDSQITRFSKHHNRSISTFAPSAPFPFPFEEKRNIAAGYHHVIRQPANCAMLRKSVNQALFVKFVGRILNKSSRVGTQILKPLICSELWQFKLIAQAELCHRNGIQVIQF